MKSCMNIKKGRENLNRIKQKNKTSLNKIRFFFKKHQISCFYFCILSAKSNQKLILFYFNDQFFIKIIKIS